MTPFPADQILEVPAAIQHCRPTVRGDASGKETGRKRKQTLFLTQQRMTWLDDKAVA